MQTQAPELIHQSASATNAGLAFAMPESSLGAPAPEGFVFHYRFGEEEFKRRFAVTHDAKIETQRRLAFIIACAGALIFLMGTGMSDLMTSIRFTQMSFAVLLLAGCVGVAGYVTRWMEHMKYTAGFLFNAEVEVKLRPDGAVYSINGDAVPHPWKDYAIASIGPEGTMLYPPVPPAGAEPVGSPVWLPYHAMKPAAALPALALEELLTQHVKKIEKVVTSH